MEVSVGGEGVGVDGVGRGFSELLEEGGEDGSATSRSELDGAGYCGCERDEGSEGGESPGEVHDRG